MSSGLPLKAMTLLRSGQILDHFECKEARLSTFPIGEIRGIQANPRDRRVYRLWDEGHHLKR